MSDSGGWVWRLPILPAHGFSSPTLVPHPIDVGGPALGIAVGAGSVWATVAHEGPGDLVRMDQMTGEVIGRFSTGDGPGSVAVGPGGVWVQVTSGSPGINIFDPSTGQFTQTVDIGGGGGLIASASGEVWASGNDTVQRLFPAEGDSPQVVGGSPQPPPSPAPLVKIPGAGGLSISSDQVWVVANPDPARNGLLYEIDRTTGDVIGAPTPVGLTAMAVAAGDGSVWVANYNDPSITRVQLLCGGAPCSGPSPLPTTRSVPTGTTALTTAPSTLPTTGAQGGGFLRTPPLPFFVGSHLVGGRFDATAATTPDGREVGTSSPVASFLPDGRLLYLAWDPGIRGTDIHVFDPRTGDDRVVVSNDSSFAVREDGAIAISAGKADLHTDPLLPSPTASPPRMGGIEVIPNARFESIVSWTSGVGTYVLVGWANSTLLAERSGPGEGTDVLAIDGPGQVRVLASNASVVAISPDGSQVLISGSTTSPSGPVPTLTVVDVSSGRTITEAPISSLIDPDQRRDIGPVAGRGDWAGDTVVMPATEGNVLLRVEPASITVERVIAIDGYFPLIEPEFIADDGNSFIGWSQFRNSDETLYSWVEVDGARDGNVRVQIGPQGDDPIRPVCSLSRPAALGGGP